MFLTRVLLNPRRRATARLVQDRRALRGEVLAAFPTPPTVVQPDRARVLWRVDREDHRLVLWCSSPSLPDFSHLVERAGWPLADASQETRDLLPLLNRLGTGQTYAFRLAANPVRAGRPCPGDPTKRFGHVTVAQQLAWLLERAELLGVEFPSGRAGHAEVRVVDRERLSFRHDAGRVTLSVATFDGLLVVREPERLRRALMVGVGRGRAYGCGLLTLARA